MSGPIFDHEPHVPSPPKDSARVELDTALTELIEHRRKCPVLTWFFPELKLRVEQKDLRLETRVLVAQEVLGIVPYPQTLEGARDQGLIPPSHWAYKADFAT